MAAGRPPLNTKSQVRSVELLDAISISMNFESLILLKYLQEANKPQATSSRQTHTPASFHLDVAYACVHTARAS